MIDLSTPIGFVKPLVKAIFATFIVFSIFIGTARYLEHSAQTKAIQFCASMSIGTRTTQLLEQALTADADKKHTHWFHHEKTNIAWLPVTFIGIPPFSRHYCSVEARNGIIISKQVKFMD